MNVSRCEQMGADERQALGRAQQLEEEQKRTQGESAQLQASCQCNPGSRGNVFRGIYGVFVTQVMFFGSPHDDTGPHPCLPCRCFCLQARLEELQASQTVLQQETEQKQKLQAELEQAQTEMGLRTLKEVEPMVGAGFRWLEGCELSRICGTTMSEFEKVPCGSVCVEIATWLSHGLVHEREQM